MYANDERTLIYDGEDDAIQNDIMLLEISPRRFESLRDRRKRTITNKTIDAFMN